MKVRSEPVNKAKSNGSARQTSLDQPNSVSGNGDCPREKMIAEAAYFRAEQRGFASGDEMTDWLQAEADVEGFLSIETH
jgi:hypothetical protein